MVSITRQDVSHIRFFAVRYWAPVVLFAVLIFIMSSIQTRQPISSFEYMDKVLHMLVYAILAGLFYRAFRVQYIWPAAYLLIIAAGISATLYGVTDEIHQLFVPTRFADIWDVTADAVGGTCGATLIHLAYGIAGRRPDTGISSSQS